MSLVRSILKERGINELTYKAEIELTDAENKYGYQGVRGQGRDKLGGWN